MFCHILPIGRHCNFLLLFIVEQFFMSCPGPVAINLYNAQLKLSMKFIYLIHVNVNMPTIDDILTFMRRIKSFIDLVPGQM